MTDVQTSNIAPFIGNVWCIDKLAYQGMVSAIDGGLDKLADRGGLFSQRRGASRKGKIAVLPLHGLVEHRQTLIGSIFGGTSTEAFGRMLDSAVSDPDVSGILIDVDSPGGSSFGVQELSDKIFQSRKAGKPIAAVANPQAASAAFWIASAAHQLFVTPSGEVGSVGVFAVHVDISEALERKGVKETIVEADGSPFKTEFADNKPLSGDARKFLQSQVNETLSTFISHLSRNRGLSSSFVRSRFGQGRSLTAKEAESRKMVDGLATVDEAVSRLMGGTVGGKGVTSTEARRRLLQMRQRGLDSRSR